MSAFMVQDKTINRVVTFLRRQLQQEWRYLAEKYQELGYDCESGDFYTKLGEDMFILNGAGVNMRYGEGQARKFRTLDYRFELEPCASQVQIYKSLSCFLYQCNEGANDKDKLFQLLEETKSVFAMYLVSRTAEYDQAEWA